MSTVGIKKTPHPSEQVLASLLDMLGSVDIRSDESVVVKPNICYHRNPHEMIVTNFRLIEVILEWLKERTSRVTVAESDNRTGSADHRIETLGLNHMLQRLDVPFANLSREKDLLMRNVGDVVFHVPRLVAEADYVVNLPKLKTCAGMTVSLSLKNSFGLVAERNKPSMHKSLENILLEVNRSIRRHLIVVDGIVGMEGNGPLLGEPVQTEAIIAGTSPVSVDATCSRIMGFDPAQISHIKTCSEGGLGPLDAEKINIVGADIAAVAKPYAPPSFAPRSIARTLKSAARLYFRKIPTISHA